MSSSYSSEYSIVQNLRLGAERLASLFLEPEDTPVTSQEPLVPQVQIPARFCSPGDIPTRHVTLNIADLVKAGFFTKNHNLTQGDIIQTMVDGVYTPWKVNRKNARTAAAKLSKELELPEIDSSGYKKRLYTMEVTGIDPVQGR